MTFARSAQPIVATAMATHEAVSIVFFSSSEFICEQVGIDYHWLIVDSNGVNLKNGLFWYRDEATYLRFRDIIEDKAQLTSPYETWVRNAQKLIEDKAKQGVFLIKINADPDEFLEWCKINSTKPDGTARTAFAIEKVRGIFGRG